MRQQIYIKSLTTVLTYGDLKACIRHRGAELISLRHNMREYIWDGDPEYWGRHSPVLFPVVGTLKDNQYRFGDQAYPLSRHGFSRDMDFILKESTARHAVFSLDSNPETLKIYPFPFELQLIYTLEAESLKIAYKVINIGEGKMFFSIGAHPAFSLPGKFEDYAIQMEHDGILLYHLLDGDLLSEATGTIMPEQGRFALDYELFEKDALVFKELCSGSLSLLHKGVPFLKVCFNDFPHLGIWTKANAPFICIEPWHGYSDTIHATGDLNDKEGIRQLDKGGVFETAFDIILIT